MELSKEDSYEILELKPGAPFSDVVKQYKFLALEWYPDKHNRNSTSFRRFQEISQAFLTFCIPDIPRKRNLMTLEEMLSLFQFIFFGNESLDEDDDDDDDDGCESESALEDSFEEFFTDWRCENVDLIRDAYNSLSCNKETLSRKNVEVKKMVVEKAVATTAEDAVLNAMELIQEEERDKKKANRRRAQKKRRKEKKKQEKNAQKKEVEMRKKDSDSDDVDESEVKQQRPMESCLSESEEELDTESAFVAVIAKKKQKSIPMKKEPDTKAKAVSEKDGSPISDLEEKSRVLRSRELALRGNEMANSGHFQEAVKLFSEAIRLEPNDHRFYGNRSYCYDRLGNFDRALSDAEKSIAIDPLVPKGYFRKGKALMSLRRYAEAEKCFNEVVRLDEQCKDAVMELFFLKVFQIMEMGFTREQAESAIREHGSVDSALDNLLPAAAAAISLKSQEDVFLSDEDDEEFLNQYSKQTAAPFDPMMDPSNPDGYNSLWVGNLQPEVTEEMLISWFSEFGEITSIKFTPKEYFAFVNYKSKLSPGKAMSALQGAKRFGKKLYIRYPNQKPSSAAKTASTSQDAAKVKIFVAPVNGRECYFWRTKGCIHGDSCRYEHILKHKGIDLKKTASKY